MLLATSGCLGHERREMMTDTATDARLTFVRIDDFSGYAIDPQTQTCVLIGTSPQQTSWWVPVDCVKLHQNVPAAKPHLPWLAGQ